MTSEFERLWVPRVGADTVREMRRGGVVVVAAGSSGIVLAVAASFGLGGSGLGPKPAGGGAALAALRCVVLVIRTRVRLAKALSKHYGVKINWWETPRMRVADFDAWTRRRGLVQSARERD